MSKRTAVIKLSNVSNQFGGFLGSNFRKPFHASVSVTNNMEPDGPRISIVFVLLNSLPNGNHLVFIRKMTHQECTAIVQQLERVTDDRRTGVLIQRATPEHTGTLVVIRPFQAEWLLSELKSAMARNGEML